MLEMMWSKLGGAMDKVTYIWVWLGTGICLDPTVEVCGQEYGTGRGNAIKTIVFAVLFNHARHLLRPKIDHCCAILIIRMLSEPCPCILQRLAIDPVGGFATLGFQHDRLGLGQIAKPVKASESLPQRIQRGCLCYQGVKI